MDKITIATCNFNTTELTNKLISSIINNTSDIDYQIVVLDNSDKIPFTTKFCNIRVIDNTKSQIIDFDKRISMFGGYTTNNYANIKHAMSVQFLLDMCQTTGLLLFDSDACLKKPIDFIDESFATIGGLQKQYVATWANNVVRLTRIVPFMQFFNTKMIRQFNIKFFDPYRIIGSSKENSNQFDTGASFYADIVDKNVPFKLIDYKQYIDHVLGASWAKNNSSCHIN